jgi:hypothetical protein
MIIWSFVLLGLGILAIFDSQFNYGYIFRTANSVMFLLVALGILIRSRMLAKFGFREQLLESNDSLRARMIAMRQTQIPSEQKETPEKVAS